MAQRRVNEVVFNFDSLTDMVTNLAGGLILIVLLLTVLTRQRATRAGEEAMRGALEVAGPSGNALELARLRGQAAAVEQRLPKVEAEIRKAREDVDRLQREVDATQPREAADPKGKPGTPSRVDLRPPMLRQTDRRPAAAFILSNKKVYYLAQRECSEAFDQEKARITQTPPDSPEMKSYMQGVVRSVNAGDFDLSFKVVDTVRVTDGWSTHYQCHVVLKPGARGETLAEALASESSVNRLLAGFDANKYYVEFGVYPDSFDLLIGFRKSILEKGFGYNWTPQSAGKELGFTEGAAMTN